MKKALILGFVIFFLGCSKKIFNEKWTTQQAPEYFKARFETTQGSFDIEAKREWSPKAVDRLHQLIKSEFYTNIAIYRVVPGFVAQFGISNNKTLNTQWALHKLNDEPVIKKNAKMTLSFARGGKKSRGTQLFINLKDNNRLDKIDFGGVKGFPVVAELIAGEENVKKFYNGYGDKLGLQQDSINTYRNDFLKRKYPKVDYIHKAYFIK